MAEKQESFKVTDRRLFTSDGDLRTDRPEEPATPPPAAAVPPAPTASAPAPPPAPAQSGILTPGEEEAALPPSAEEQQVQADAYKQSSKDLDARVELSGHSARELEMTFERFMASLYMSAMLQLGLMREQNAPPAVDLIGARQTIDTLRLLAEKTKGNLTAAESNFLQNCLYELRMAYVEVTNAISRPPSTDTPKAVPHPK